MCSFSEVFFEFHVWLENAFPKCAFGEKKLCEKMHSSSMKNSSGLSSRHHGDRGSQYDGRSGSDDGLPLVSSDIII